MHFKINNNIIPMKNKYLTLFAFLSSHLFVNALTFNNFSFIGGVEVDSTDLAFFIVDINDLGFSSLTTIDANPSASSSLTDAGFFVGSPSGETTLDDGFLSHTNTVFDFSSVNSNDPFGILVFDNNPGPSGAANAGDTYKIWTFDSGTIGVQDGLDWLIPSSDGVYGFGNNFTQINSAGAFVDNGGGFTGTVVPEPSTYALFAGILALGFIVVRRSRSRG